MTKQNKDIETEIVELEDVGAFFDEVFDEPPKESKKGSSTRKMATGRDSETPARPRTAAEILPEASAEVIKDFDEAMKSLREIFGGKSLKSFPASQDKDTYANYHRETTFIPDPFARSIRLEIKISDGKVTMIDGEPLTDLKSETIAELILPAFAIKDDKIREALTKEEKVLLLPAETTLWARVKEDSIETDLKPFREQKNVSPGVLKLFVGFIIKSDLYLLLKAGKNATLMECECYLPALKTQASSVNEAYTKISTVFEPSRRSHTGNVFSCVYLENDKTFFPLDFLRLDKEAESRSPE